eukprot:5448-Heterococcus_DN1.PRE.1
MAYALSALLNKHYNGASAVFTACTHMVQWYCTPEVARGSCCRCFHTAQTVNSHSVVCGILLYDFPRIKYSETSSEITQFVYPQ